MSREPYDVMERIAKALEDIVEQLERIAVADGPCDSEHEVTWNENTTITHKYYCVLKAGHSGLHTDLKHAKWRDAGRD